MTRPAGTTKNLQVRILFDHPNPFLFAHGGLKNQIEQTKKALEEEGVQVDFLRWWDERQKADLVHFFGRPHPAYIQQALKKNIPVIFSDLLGGLGSRPFHLRFIQRCIIRLARLLLPPEFTIRMGWASYELASRVIALTTWEKRLMTEQFGALSQKVAVVPNGVEKIFFQKQSAGRRQKHLIAAMTITEVKRPIELVQAAALAKIKIRIIGDPYQNQAPFFRRFLKEVGRAKPWVDYLGGIRDRKKLAAEFKQANGFVLLSSWESQSLAALEAAASGCPLLLSDLPWARSTFGEQATYAPVTNASRTAKFLKTFALNASQAPRFRQALGWRDVAKQLKKIYSESIISR